MLKRLPLIPTLVVLIAVAVMVRLGFWQLERKTQKEALLVHYATAAKAPEVPFEGWLGTDPATSDRWLYRRVWMDCVTASNPSARAGHNAAGETGWAHVVQCSLQRGGEVNVVLGWSAAPQPVAWQGGLVHGMFGPGHALVADPPLAGLQASARPDPTDTPNNHLSYALQWFAFAASALAIYALALRKRLAAGGEGG